MKLKHFILSFVTLIMFLIGTQAFPAVFGATDGFTFPIGELGNCATVTECGNYCEKIGRASCRERV